MSIWNKIQRLLSIRSEYDEASQEAFDGFARTAKELESLSAMRKTEGWIILEERIRQEVHTRIFEKVKDDPQITSLVNLLKLGDSKSQWKQLEEEIDKLLPE